MRLCLRIRGRTSAGGLAVSGDLQAVALSHDFFAAD